MDYRLLYGLFLGIPARRYEASDWWRVAANTCIVPATKNRKIYLELIIHWMTSMVGLCWFITIITRAYGYSYTCFFLNNYCKLKNQAPNYGPSHEAAKQSARMSESVAEAAWHHEDSNVAGWKILEMILLFYGKIINEYFSEAFNCHVQLPEGNLIVGSVTTMVGLCLL
jgi:hypothetical protein